MAQLKYPNKSITQPQIKKIHTLKSILKLSDDNYEALLSSLNVESSTELTRGEAAALIDLLVSWEKGEKVQLSKQAPQIKRDGIPCFDRVGKATDKQLYYIAGLWLEVSNAKTYKSLMWFVKRVTGTLYIHIESLSIAETRKVINALKAWNNTQQKKQTSQR